MICNRCKVDKSVEEFVFGRLKCKRCYKKCHDYYKANREKEIARAQRSNARKDRAEENKRKREAIRKNPVAYMLWTVKSRAKIRGIPFNLTHEDIIVPSICPVLGIPMFIGSGIATGNSPSIDRINSNFGYVKGNIQIISNRANTIKSNATLDELKAVVAHMEKTPIVKNGEMFQRISRREYKWRAIEGRTGVF